MTVLVTGAAGFIGFALASRLLEQGESVYGIDNLTPYYDVALKEARLALLKAHPGFRFAPIDIADRTSVEAFFVAERFDIIVHLAAQAGVRYSLEKPLAYVDANLVGLAHVLEGARAQRLRHFVFAPPTSASLPNPTL